MSGLVFKSGYVKLGNVNAQPIQQGQTLKSLSINESSAKIGPALKDEMLIETMKQKNSSLFTDLFPVMPAFRPLFPAPKSVDTRLKGREPGPDVRYSAYEELTGISRVRPEILFVTNFQPLFDKPVRGATESLSRRKDISTPGLNSVGEFFDAQIQLQHLRHEAIVKLVKDLKQDSDVAFELNDKQNDFQFHIKNLSSHVQTLYDIIDDIERLKLKLDIKNSEGMSYETISHRYFATTFVGGVGTISGIRIVSAPEFDITQLGSLSYAKVLGGVGFDPINVKKFSSTKVVLQSLYELLGLLRGNSYNLLGATTNEQRSDDSATYLKLHSPVGFAFNPGAVSAVLLEQIQRVSKDNTFAIVNALKTSFDSLFASTNFTSSESKIAYLFNFLSREFVFSKGLSNARVRASISETYGYTISDALSNEQMLDVIFGNSVDKIVEPVNVFSNNSLSTIAQKLVNNVAVLNFEPDYIDFEQSVFTPGASYFLNQALELTEDGKFNLTNLGDFSNDLGKFLERFTKFVQDFNLLPTQKKSHGSGFADKMVHGRLIFEQVSQEFLNLATYQPLPEISTSDALAVFTSAEKDNYLKSLLFLYVTLKLYGSSSDTAPAALEAVIKEIDSRINSRQSFRRIETSAVAATFNKSILSTSRFGISNLSQHSMSTELKEFRNTSKFLNAFFNSFKNIVDAFGVTNSQNSNIIVNGHTRFSAIQDTVLMMIVFESLLTAIATYTPKTLQGRFTTRSSSTVGQFFYRFQVAEVNGLTSTKNSLSFNTVRGKINFDVDMISKISFMLLGSMLQLKDSIDGIIKSMSQESKIKPINDILAVLGNRRLLSMILNPQQIFLIKSLVDDINDKLSSDASLPKQSENVDFELRGPGRDDVSLLDDSLIQLKLKKALYAFFSNERFSSQKGHNIRLLTVGIPSGFSQKLRERVKLDKVNQNSFNPKQVDVIKINVFKVDVEHQDIIFKPQSFLFELSRFVQRSGVRLPDLEPGMPLKKILESLPSRDYSLEVPSQSPGAPGIENTNLFSSQYSFLTQEQKTKLIQNHTESYFLELYVKLLTGISVSEYDLYIDPNTVPYSTVSPLFLERAVTNVVQTVFPSLQVLAKDSVKTSTNFAVNLAVTKALPPVTTKDVLQKVKFSSQSVIPLAKMSKLEAGAGVVDSVKKARTVFSDNLEESKRIFLPKAFDRVFNIAVDPDDFEIDVEETLKTPSGKDAFDKLLKQGVIVGNDTQASFFATSGISGFKIRERDINENDLTFEKYFITIDTVMDEVV